MLSFYMGIFTIFIDENRKYKFKNDGNVFLFC